MRYNVFTLLARLGFGNKRSATQVFYNRVVAAARDPRLYKLPFSVPDTPEGRFEALNIHLWLVLRGLKGDARANVLMGLFARDLDASARELGVGDLSVGKKVKDLVAIFYGRIILYDRALKQDDSRMALQEAFGTPVPALADLLPAYAQRIEHWLNTNSSNDFPLWVDAQDSRLNN